MVYSLAIPLILLSLFLPSSHGGMMQISASAIDIGTVATVSPYQITISKTGSIISAIDSNNIVKYSGTSASAAIQSAINIVKLKNVFGIVHISAGKYLLGNSVILSGVSNIQIEGDGKTLTILQCSVANTDLFVKAGATPSSYITIKNLDIDGANISGKLMDFGNISNLLIDGVILERHNDPLPGVYLVDLTSSTIQNSILRNPHNSGDVMAVTGTGITFQNNDIARTGAKGGGLTSGNLMDSRIVNNNFHDFNGYAAVSLENFNLAYGQYSFKNVEIGYNTFNNLTGNAIHSLGYSGPGQFYYLQIHGNIIQNAIGNGVMLNAYDTQPNVMTYNTNIVNNTLLYTAGMSLGPLSNCLVNNNVIGHTSNWRGYGIYLYPGSNDVSMNGNTISYTKNAPYYYSGSTGITINGVKVA